ncbi:MAG: ABC transporter permease [Crocinitomicaceae bacterium]|jgi:ABC-2 type transport system permease protein|nr:ABC transporter permease [Crocinitomicaceae bacterium]
MKTLKHIIYREWITRVRRKAFLLGTLVAPLLIALGIGVKIWLASSTDEEAKVLVVDASGLISRFEDRLDTWVPICPDCFPERSTVTYRFAPESLSDDDFVTSDFDLMVFFDDGILQHSSANYFYEKAPAMGTTRTISNDLASAIERFKVKRDLELDYAAYKRLKTSIRLVGEDVITRDGNATGRALIGFVFSLLLFLQIMVFGMHVMRGVIEEKANRIVEVVISVVTPLQLMTGKIIGIGLVGLTQFALLFGLSWLVYVVGGQWLEANEWLKTSADSAVSVDLETWMANQSELSFLLDVNWPLMVFAAAVFFALGYFMYACIFAAIGASVDQESDAQYLMIPAMIPPVLAYILAASSIENPEGDLAIYGSYFPLTAPIMMLTRIPVGVAWWEVLLSVSGVAVTAYLLLRVSARIFRIGILSHGKKLTFKVFWKRLKQRN